jgi:hypothetical protein
VRDAIHGDRVHIQGPQALLAGLCQASLGRHDAEELSRLSYVASGQDAQQQPYAERGLSESDVCVAEGARAQAVRPRRQRGGTDEARIGDGCGFGLGNQCSRDDRQRDAAAPLQDRCRESGAKDRRGNRRGVPQFHPAETGGCTQRYLLEIDRVDGIEIYKQGCGPEFDRLCPGGVVYDLTVDEVHNFFASGYLVHNSQRLRNPASDATRGVMALANRAKRVVMLSGTPIVNQPSDLAVPLSILTQRAMTPKAFDEHFVGKKTLDPGFWGRLQGAQPAQVPTIQHEDELEDMLRGHVDYQAPKLPDGVHTNEERVLVDLSRPQKDFYRLMWHKLPILTRWKMENDYPMSGQELHNLQAFMTGPRQAALSLLPFRPDGDAHAAFRESSKLQAAFQNAHATLKSDPRAKVLAYSNFIDAGLTPYAAGLKAHGIPYSFLHGSLNDAQRKSELDNYNTGKTRVLLLGPSAAEGISAQGTQLIQLLDPHWNEARMGQAQGRGIRFDSHVGLPENLRNVKIQRYIAKMPDPGFFGRLFGGASPPSADQFLEAQSRRKEDLNNQFRDVLKRVGSEPPTHPWWSFS